MEQQRRVSTGSSPTRSPRRSLVARKPKRKSDPVRPGKASLARQQDSWEFPLSREEKKFRVLYLFEQELAQAQRTGQDVEALLDENQALHARLESLGESRRSSLIPEADQEASGEEEENLPTASSPEATAESVSLEREDDEECAEDSGAHSDGQAQRRQGSGVSLAALGGLCIAAALVAALCNSTRPASPQGRGGAADVLGSQALETRAPETAPASSLNATAAALRLQAHGMQRLQVSDCWKAEWYFASAQKLLEDQVESEGLKASLTSLLSDRSFALICAQRFGEGAALLEQQLRGSLQQNPPSYLLNALGYARFQQQDYPRAEDAFTIGVRKDPQNPLLWNNLGATKMVLGDLQGADDALFQAGDFLDVKQAKATFQVQEYHQLMIMNNAQELLNRVKTGQASIVPTVDLWWGGEAAEEASFTGLRFPAEL